MALDFSKLTAVVHKVADLAHSHANLSTVAGIAADAEKTAQAEIDSIVEAIEAALGQTLAPVTQAGAAGLAAVAQAIAANVATDSAPTPVPAVAAPVVQQTPTPAVPPSPGAVPPAPSGPVTGIIPDWLKAAVQK